LSNDQPPVRPQLWGSTPVGPQNFFVLFFG
jgi:hypothetical protein